MSKPVGPRPGKRIVRRSTLLDSKLDAGDAIEFGTTLEISAGGSKIWLRAGTTVHVRPDEKASIAWNRATTFVQECLDQQAAELTN